MAFSKAYLVWVHSQWLSGTHQLNISLIFCVSIPFAVSSRVTPINKGIFLSNAFCCISSWTLGLALALLNQKVYDRCFLSTFPSSLWSYFSQRVVKFEDFIHKQFTSVRFRCHTGNYLPLRFHYWSSGCRCILIVWVVLIQWASWHCHYAIYHTSSYQSSCIHPTHRNYNVFGKPPKNTGYFIFHDPLRQVMHIDQLFRTGFILNSVESAYSNELRIASYDRTDNLCHSSKSSCLK